MKKSFLILVAALTIFSGCNNSSEEQVDASVVNNPNTATADANAKLPKIKFTEERFDFGEITQGEKVEHTFEFTNTGDADLIITSAKGSCGCTVPEWPKKPIKPGEKGVIDVVFNSEGKSGKQHKKVTVVANTQPSTSEFVITGHIIVPETKAE